LLVALLVILPPPGLIPGPGHHREHRRYPWHRAGTPLAPQV